MDSFTITSDDMELYAEKLAARIIQSGHEKYILCAIPRGGVPVAYAIRHKLSKLGIFSAVHTTAEPPPPLTGATVLVDDIAVTGFALDAAAVQIEATPVLEAVIVAKPSMRGRVIYAVDVDQDVWVEFSWEAKEQGGKPLDAVIRLIEYLGDDPTRDGLLKTPERFLEFLDEQRIGEPYEATVFKSDITDLQVENNIPFSSLCEHHILPYFGTASVGYIPNGNLLGLSKLVRILADHGRGLTMQEVVTAQTAAAIENAAGTPDVAVITTAQHSCMIVRGVKAHGTTTTSSAMLGKFKAVPALRAEFIALAGIS